MNESNAVKINAPLFFQRSKKIYEAVQKPVLIMLGRRADVPDFNMNSALFNYTLGFEFSETAVLIGEEITVIYTSPKKAMILEQLVHYDRTKVRIVLKTPETSHFVDSLNGIYGIVDIENTHGDFCQSILSKVRSVDVSLQINKMFLYKDESEISDIKNAGLVCDYLLEQGIGLARDGEFSADSLEACITERRLRNYFAQTMGDVIVDISVDAIEFSIKPIAEENSVRIGVRYKGYCAEVGRVYLADVSEEYATMKSAIEKIKVGEDSSVILSELNKIHNLPIRMYTIGLNAKELGFEVPFKIQNNISFVINVNGLINTFVVADGSIKYVTKEDSFNVYLPNKMRFRNKTVDFDLQSKIKDHQKELLDKLLEERVSYFSKNAVVSAADQLLPGNQISYYEDDESVPRSKSISIDYDNFYVMVPILVYSVPVHVSCIKNVSMNEHKLRINFNKKVYASENAHPTYDTFIKSISIPVSDPSIITSINMLKRDFLKPKVFCEKQAKLIQKSKCAFIRDVIMKTDTKTNKKATASLECHENGFRYGETVIVFSNILRAFFSCNITRSSDTGEDVILHFHLKENQMINGKITKNVQFVKGNRAVNYHDCSKKENEHLEMIRAREEEEELNRHIFEYRRFIDSFNNSESTTLKIETVDNKRGFYGVYHKEANFISFTNDCLVSLTETPFFILNLNEIEVVNLERVTGATKTFDIVAVKRLDAPISNSGRNQGGVVFIGAIETTKLNFIKTVLDSMNILFMDTKVNINWTQLMSTITKDPLNFYENGGWSELLVEDVVESSSESSSSAVSSDESMDVSSSNDSESVVSSDVSSSDVSSEEGSFDTSSFVESDSDSDYERPKKVKSGRR